MDISEVSSILGHVGEQTLINHYLYSTKSANTRLDRLEQSLAMQENLWEHLGTKYLKTKRMGSLEK